MESSTVPHRCYSRLFWGFIVVLVDIGVNRFDILPDFIGYWMISTAARDLSSVGPEFRAVRSLAGVLAALDIIQLFSLSSPLGSMLGIVGILLSCALVWQLLGGVARDCFVHGHYDLVQSAHFRRSLYLGCMIAVALLWIAAFYYQQVASAIGLIVVLTGIFATLLVVALLRTARLRLFGA
ncbi:MAG: hypothetical protein H7A55_16210 [Verrucomicrobiaceae bacterium]|nr:hypothetical protein [Verrucomicrobiaceae bacterium]